ncbi:hypothetical protein Emag_000619 [Eimeria magna]
MVVAEIANVASCANIQRSLTPLDVASLFGHDALAKLLEAQALVYSSAHYTFTTTDPVRKSADGRSSVLVPSISDGHSSTHSQGDRCCVSAREAAEFESRGPEGNCRIFSRWALALMIVFLSLYDYASRVNLAALIAAVAQKAQGASPILYAAAALASASVVLPSVAIWICCYSHFKSTWAWASWKAAGVVRLFADSAKGNGTEGVSQGVIAVRELRAVRRLTGLRRLACSSSSPLLARLTVGGFILPLAAFVGSLVVCMQVTAVVVAASFVIVVMCAYISFGLLATKCLLGFQGGLLHLLDTLSYASAVKLTAASRCERKNELGSKAAFPSSCPTSEERHSQEPGCQADGQHELLQPGPPRSPPPSECRQGLRIISEDAAGCESVSPGGARGSAGWGCRVVVDDNPAAPQDEGSSRLEANAHLMPHCLTSIAPSYRKATFSGSVPLELHPCICLKGAILLHQQRLRSSKERNRLSTGWNCSQAVHGKDDGVRSSADSRDKGDNSRAARTKKRAGLSAAGSDWRFHGSSAGLFADSVRPTVAGYTACAEICEEAKKKYWSSGLDAGSIVNLSSKADSIGECLPSDGAAASSNECGLLSFAYGGWPRQERQLNGAMEGSSDTSHQSEGAFKRVTSPGMRAENLAFLLTDASPFRWLRGRTTQQSGTTVCPQSSQSLRTQATRISRPGIPAAPWGNKGRASFPFDRDCHKLRSSPISPGPQHSWLGVKLLYTANGAQAAALTPGDATQKHQAESALVPQPKVCIFKSRRQKPAAVELDSADYRDLVLQRKQRIFKWFEQIVAVRYLEVRRLTQATATVPKESDSEDEPYRFEKVPIEPALPSTSRSTSIVNGKESIKWSSFQTLFPAGPSTHRVEDSSSVSAAGEPHKSEVLSCVLTEDLFYMSVKDPTPRSWLLQSGKRCQERRRVLPSCESVVYKPYADTREMTGSHKVADLCPGMDGSSSCGVSSTEALTLPVIHYRFNDMVEMPHLREAFFIFWSREFEKLLIYQDQYFGDNPMWIGNVLEEDSISAFSQELLFSSTFTANCTSSSDPRLPRKEKLQMKDHLSKGVHWLIAQRERDHRGPCEERSVIEEIDEPSGCKACTERFGGPTGICICQGVPEPPMTYIIGIDLAELENSRRLTYVEDKLRVLNKQRGHEPSDGEAAPPIPYWQHSPATSTSSEGMEAAEATRSAGEGSGKLSQGGLPVIEACRFMFVLVLTTDLLLGLFPLLASLLLIYFLPEKGIDLSVSPARDHSELPGDCADLVLAPFSIPGGYLVSSQSMTTTVALCALHFTSFWSIFLALLASLMHAALLSGQATNFFLPMSTRCVPVNVL